MRLIREWLWNGLYCSCDYFDHILHLHSNYTSERSSDWYSNYDKIKPMANPSMALFLLLTVAIGTGKLYQFAEGGGKRRIHITDDLDDVVDDEEDDSWREWGKTKSTAPDFDPPPEDFSNLDPSKMQEEMLKRQFGSVLGFVKLRLLGSPRTSVSTAIRFVSLFLLSLFSFFFFGKRKGFLGVIMVFCCRILYPKLLQSGPKLQEPEAFRLSLW